MSDFPDLIEIAVQGKRGYVSLNSFFTILNEQQFSFDQIYFEVLKEMNEKEIFCRSITNILRFHFIPEKSDQESAGPARRCRGTVLHEAAAETLLR